MPQATANPNRMLLLSTVAFTVCFAAWMINGVLVTFLTNNGIFKWSSTQTGWLLGAPVLVGSILRLPVGVLTDKYGGKWMMTILLLLSALPMYLLSMADSYASFLLLSFAFGIAGSSFAAGVAYTTQWFPKERQGTALGIFAMGNVGAAATTFFAPQLLDTFTHGNTVPDGWRMLPQLYAAVLAATAVLFFLFTVNKRSAGVKSMAERLAPLRQTRVWRFGLYYFFVFGSFVALSQWLIPYYVNVYSLSIVAAGMMTTAFSLPSGLVRMVGGLLSDKYGARIVLIRVFTVAILCLLFLIPPRVEMHTPGQGIMASRPGVVEAITADQITVADPANPEDKTVYALRTADPLGIRFGIHRDEEGFLPMPFTSVWQDPQVQVGETVGKGQLLAKGTTHIYFQANKWIFSFLVFLIGAAMGIGGAAVFKLIPDYYPDDVGTVGGIVGVLGGLGGFVGPILFGMLLASTGVWTTCWVLLLVIAVVCALWMRSVLRRIARGKHNH